MQPNKIYKVADKAPELALVYFDPKGRAFASKHSSLKVGYSTFEGFSVVINDHELSSEDWQHKKARDVFKILLFNHRKSVTIDELIDFL